MRAEVFSPDRSAVRANPDHDRAYALDPPSLARHHAHMLIYKILRAPEWADLQAKGETAGAPIDVSDGFVHFSTAAQARETAAKHFAGEVDLTLAALDAERLGAALKWEVSRGGAEFPHLYAPLRLADIVWSEELPLGDGGHQFPETMV
ncbi:MAG: DUF952 domain-containing protein [Pelagimonas sp.]|uniref:DUF952 domain-containing protein n=1 Tax=Pelagimonas sp. TaxID=2073170 RepID=UPI003D6BC470